uniref:CSP3 n=1 Tax=Holotrichia parallela TaxID=93412 RepID=A0A0G2YGW7_HOLPA|nr:CSP3 [Holotrichia parallela]
MFKSFLIISVLAVVVLSKAEDGQYTTKYDRLDLDAILNNDRLLQTYIKCLLDLGPCTPDGKVLRDLLADALESGCSKCNETQRDGATKVIRFLTKNKKEDWEALKKKYDPNGKYVDQYRKMSENENLKI